MNGLFHLGSIDKKKQEEVQGLSLRPLQYSEVIKKRGRQQRKKKMARGEKLKEYDILETKREKCSEEQ